MFHIKITNVPLFHTQAIIRDQIKSDIALSVISLEHSLF